jgi:hypothetical protein
MLGLLSIKTGAPRRAVALVLVLVPAAPAACSASEHAVSVTGPGGDASPDAAPGDAFADDRGSSVVPDGGSTAPDADAAKTSKDGGDGETVVMGGPGCGLPSAAFCETFDAPAAMEGRAGELDVRGWSGGRLTGTGVSTIGPTAFGEAFSIGMATLAQPPAIEGGATPPACRAGLPLQVRPDGDTLVCDPNPGIQSNYLLTAVAAQNYGQNSYRIRQPFDFAGRTGKIVFDAEGFTIGSLWGWVSLEVTEDPVPVPAYSLGPFSNDEGTAIPINAFELQFDTTCNAPSSVGLASILVYQNQLVTVTSEPQGACVATEQGNLNHFEVDVSETEIDVYGTPFSEDGVTFAPSQLLYKATVALPFSRGYVHITTHNHATLKYTGSGSEFQGHPSLDAWEARWDNVGFDGPIIGGWREYEAADSLVSGTDTSNGTPVPYENVGFIAPDESSGPSATLHLSGVDLSGATSATLVLAAYYPTSSTPDPSTYALEYRLNGHAWHARPFTASELAYITGATSRGLLTQTMSVPVSELVSGDNTLEFVTANVPQSYPPAVVDIDLVLSTP